MSTVFIPQLPTRYDKATGKRVPSIDTNPAAQYGDLVSLFSIDVTREEALEALRERYADGWEWPEIKETDYILAVGDVVLLSLTIVHALRINGRATLLRWDNELRQYRTEVVTE